MLQVRCTSNTMVFTRWDRKWVYGIAAETHKRRRRIDCRRRLAHSAEQNAYKYGRISVTSLVTDGYEVAVLFSQEKDGYRLVVNGANIVDTNFTITNHMNIDGKLEGQARNAITLT